MACWYDEALGDINDIPSCHCSTIVITSQADFPNCSVSATRQPPHIVALERPIPFSHPHPRHACPPKKNNRLTLIRAFVPS